MNARHAKPDPPVDEPEKATLSTGDTVKIFGREPALWLAAISAVVSLGSQLIWHLSDTQQGALNGAAVFLVGLLTAISVDHEKLVPAIMGLLGALLSVGLAFGWQLDATSQNVIMTAAATIVAMFVRTQVTVDLPKHYADDPEPLEAPA